MNRIKFYLDFCGFSSFLGTHIGSAWELTISHYNNNTTSNPEQLVRKVILGTFEEIRNECKSFFAHRLIKHEFANNIAKKKGYYDMLLSMFLDRH